MKGLFTSIIIALACSLTFSQELSHKVIVSGAAVHYNTNIAIFYQHTVGEPVVQLLTADGISLTQGFQQPAIVIKPDPSDDSGVRFYPNPVSVEGDKDGVLTMEIFAGVALPWSYKITVSNIAGAIVYREVLDLPADGWSTYSNGGYYHKRLIDMQSWYKGLYLVRVVRSDGEVDEAKILKM